MTLSSDVRTGSTESLTSRHFIKDIKSEPHSALVCSVAGGRKTDINLPSARCFTGVITPDLTANPEGGCFSLVRCSETSGSEEFSNVLKGTRLPAGWRLGIKVKSTDGAAHLKCFLLCPLYHQILFTYLIFGGRQKSS